MGWVSPTGHSDPDSAWIAETQAYDDDEGLAAVSWTVDKYLELTLGAAISCDKIQIKAGEYESPTYGNADVSIDVYYSAGWHNIFSGTCADRTWEEKAIGSTQNVDKARIKADSLTLTYIRLYEFDFNEAVAPPEGVPAQAFMHLQRMRREG